MKKIINNNITLVAASDIKIEETLIALYKSANLLSPYKTIFFSSKIKLLNKKYDFILHKRIDPLRTLSDYSSFLIFELHKYVETSHVLIVQWDGYILNPKKWSDSFLNYDYIGAPFIPRINDPFYSRDSKGNFYVIGNGGFSLRSKKLLEAPSKFKLVDDLAYTNSNEDGFFCVLHRKFLEGKGFKWAPFQTAQRFSIETPINFRSLINLPFGFHGKKMLLILGVRKLFHVFLYLILLIFYPNND